MPSRTLKGGSTIGIPSAPGIWIRGEPPGRAIVTPGISDAERLQGFPEDWTSPALVTGGPACDGSWGKRGDGGRRRLARRPPGRAWQRSRRRKPSWPAEDRWPAAAWGRRAAVAGPGFYVAAAKSLPAPAGRWTVSSSRR